MEAKDQSIQCHMEASFIQTVARPLWDSLAVVLPALGPAVKRMAVNSDIYMALAQLAPHKITKVWVDGSEVLSRQKTSISVLYKRHSV